MNTQDEARIAVIAIHGVGDHQPFEMARSAGDLLGNLVNPNGDATYCAFGEHFIRVPPEPVRVPDPSFVTAPGVATEDLHRATVKEHNSWGPLDAAWLIASQRGGRREAKILTISLWRGNSPSLRIGIPKRQLQLLAPGGNARRWSLFRGGGAERCISTICVGRTSGLGKKPVSVFRRTVSVAIPLDEHRRQ